MATSYGQQAEKRGLPPALIIVGLVLLVALAGYLGYRAMPKQGGASAQMSSKTEMLMQYAKKCQGDFSKLSPADQQKVNEMAGNGQGPLSMATLYKSAQALGK